MVGGYSNRVEFVLSADHQWGERGRAYTCRWSKFNDFIEGACSDGMLKSQMDLAIIYI